MADTFEVYFLIMLKHSHHTCETFILLLRIMYYKGLKMGDLPKHLLYPADIFVDKIPHIVSTVLGSCISVCLYDPVLKLGAINHFILPQWNGHDLATMKYGNLATIRILEELLNYGSQYENLVAKIFGGADALTKTPTNFHIGKRNAQMALEILDEFRIPIVQINTGGNQGRKIGFNTYTGEVEHLFIRRRDNQSYSGSSGLLEGFLKRKEILLSGIGNPPQK